MQSYLTMNQAIKITRIGSDTLVSDRVAVSLINRYYFINDSDLVRLFSFAVVYSPWKFPIGWEAFSSAINKQNFDDVQESLLAQVEHASAKLINLLTYIKDTNSYVAPTPEQVMDEYNLFANKSVPIIAREHQEIIKMLSEIQAVHSSTNTTKI